jgi:molecular chaperone GrpE
MSEPAPPDLAGSAAVGGAAAVTPEQIEAILADFRDWLREAARSEAPPVAEPVDLYTLVAQFTALRQEVNLQTRAVRQQQEQNAETLRQLEAAVRQPAAPVNDDRTKSLLNALIDVADTQQRAAAEMNRVAKTVADIVDYETTATNAPKPSFFRRLLGVRPTAATIDLETLERLRETIDAAVAGLEMGLQRIGRGMRTHGLEPIAAIGVQFDPESMEAIEVVADSDRPAGEVVIELRRGYRWNGRVLRYAQVRVAK